MRSALREATREVHERLHAAEPFVAIAQERLSVCGYAALLGKIAGFHLSVVPTPETSGARRALIFRDLQALKVPAPAHIAWNAPSGMAARLGCAYVVEGSSLGGKVIYRQLDYLFGDSAAGRRFFGGSPSDGKRWRALCQRIEATGRDPISLREMLAGAQRTFALFEQILVPVNSRG